MNATIISPVSRHLAVTDIQQSLNFYTGQLGFEKISDDPPEVGSGAAQLSFHTTTNAIDSSGTLRPPGKAILFFEVNDVQSMLAKFRSQQVDCSDPEKVNWIKMEMFCVKDPDGHQLWFGRSYHHEYEVMHSGEFEGQMRTIMPTFPCKNVPASVQYYVTVLGFSVNYQQDDFAVLDRDKIRILLMQGDEKNTGTGNCYVYIHNADDLFKELKSRSANITGEPVSRPWGLREFLVKDPDGNSIGLGQTFE